MTRSLLVTLVAALVLGSCAGEPPREQTAKAQRSPVSVEVETVQPSEVRDEISLVGTVAARNQVAVASKILSYVRTIGPREGDRVQAGETVAELDDRELRSTVKAAQASKAEAVSAIATVEHSIAAAQARLELAETTYRRFADLLEEESATRQEYDEAKATLETARASVELARSQKEQALAKQAQAEAAIARAEVMLGYARVTSPVTGVVTERLADPGALASPGAPLLRIEEAGAYRLEVAVPETRAGGVRVGMMLPIRLDSLGENGPQQGRIVEIVPAIDPGSRTLIAKIALPTGPSIRSGLYGRAFLSGETRMTLTAPTSAIVERGQLRSVFVVEDGAARRRLVTLGETRNGRYEALSGLSAGDQVILNPAEVREGDPVNARERRPAESD